MQIEMWTKYDTKQTSYNPNMRLMVESEKKTTESEHIERELESVRGSRKKHGRVRKFLSRVRKSRSCQKTQTVEPEKDWNHIKNI